MNWKVCKSDEPCERRQSEQRTNYRTPVGQLIFAIQTAARHGFPLRVVAAGSMWATFALTGEELAKLVDSHVALTLD